MWQHLRNVCWALTFAGGASLAFAQDGGDFGGGPRGGFGGPPDPGRFFDRFDENGDGTLDDDEIENAPGFLRERLAEAAQEGPLTKRRFTEMQANMGFGGGRGGRGGRGRGGPPGESRDQNGDGEDRDNGKENGGDKNGAKKKEPRQVQKMVAVLPENYRSYDTDLDNQVALYEWERARYGEFFKLDRNGDGFLTARELLAPPPRPAGTTLMSRGPRGTGGPGAGGQPTAPAAPPAPTPAQLASQGPPPDENPNDEPLVREGKYIFRLMDNNKNSLIDEDEWARSAKVRPLFAKAGLPAELPMNRDVFVELYQRAKQFEREQGG